MINPFKTQLTILQQEGYSVPRFLNWWFRNPLTYTISTKKPLLVTSKIKTILSLSYILLLSSFLLFSFFHSYLSAIVLTTFLLTQPFLLFSFSLLLLKPYEIINKQKTINKTRNTLLEYNPTTIAITGSFGKTSVKDFLFTILSGYQQTLKTPESYNTIFGIAKVVEFELLKKTKFFICEMGAYVRGEIAKLCFMVPPNYSILTAVGNQHLERFKTIENTTLAKFEIIDSTINKNQTLVNIDNSYIAKHLKLSKYENVQTYSLKDSSANFYIENYTLTEKGTAFTLVHQNQKHQYRSSLFGTSNLYNLTAAISMSLILKVPPKTISNQVSKIVPSPHRLELKKLNNKSTLIDNAFSSNEEGFSTIISDLSKLKGKKALITPGIIELGNKTESVHRKLGNLASQVFDEFIFVGISDRTLTFQKSLPKNAKVNFVENSTNLWPLIENLSKSYDWILLENDLPDTF